MPISENALACCKLAEEEDRLDENINALMRASLALQAEMRVLISKRDALHAARHFLLNEGNLK